MLYRPSGLNKPYEHSPIRGGMLVAIVFIITRLSPMGATCFLRQSSH